jgi:hypothetical protein
MTAGYSGTPLARKLGLKDGSTVRVINPPAGYTSLLKPIPDGVRFVSSVSATTDIVHLFTTRKAELVKTLAHLRTRIRPDAMVWVSWPKKAAKMDTDITEDTIRQVAIPMGYVDIKVAAFDAVWSALKLVIQKALR